MNASLAADSKARTSVSPVMRRFRSINHNLPALALVLIILLAMSAQASPDSNQSWTQMPWSSTTEVPSGQNVTTLSHPLAFNISRNEPQILRLGSDHLNFSEYVPSPFLSELWVRTGVQWGRYDQIELCDLLDERDLILAGEQIGLVTLLMRLISFANDATGAGM